MSGGKSMYGSYGRFCDGLFSFGRYQWGGYIMMGLGFILILVITYFAFKRGSFSPVGNSESPLDIQQKRFVNGEINQEEFIEKREIIRKIK